MYLTRKNNYKNLFIKIELYNNIGTDIIMSAYNHIFSNKAIENLGGVVKALKNKAYPVINLLYEAIIFCVWWIFVCIIFISLSIKNILSFLPIINNIVDITYLFVIKLISLTLEKMKYINPEHSRRKIIHDKTTGDQYLERYYLLIKDREQFPFNIFLHKFINGDNDEIHDHPWGFFHIILSGGYWEYITINEDGETLDQGIKKVWREPGYYNIASPNYKHKIVLGNVKPMTLFIPFKKTHKWGFWVPMIWKNGSKCLEGSIKNDENLTSKNWKKIGYDDYFKQKLNKC